MKLGYNEFGSYENLVITYRFLSQIGYFYTQIDPVITIPGYNIQTASPELFIIAEFNSSRIYILSFTFRQGQKQKLENILNWNLRLYRLRTTDYLIVF